MDVTPPDRLHNSQSQRTEEGKDSPDGVKQNIDPPPSILSFIYDDNTTRMKNIEDFGAPLS